MNNTSPSDFLRTSDIWVIAYLLAVGEKYISIDRQVNQGKAKVYFLFPPEVEEQVHDYFNGASISAVQFKNSIENVKSILFDF